MFTTFRRRRRSRPAESPCGYPGGKVENSLWIQRVPLWKTLCKMCITHCKTHFRHILCKLIRRFVLFFPN